MKAALLLGQTGLEVGEIPERLKKLDTTKNLESIEPVVHTDIEGFLRNEHENAILSGILVHEIEIEDPLTGFWYLRKMSKSPFL